MSSPPPHPLLIIVSFCKHLGGAIQDGVPEIPEICYYHYCYKLQYLVLPKTFSEPFSLIILSSLDQCPLFKNHYHKKIITVLLLQYKKY